MSPSPIPILDVAAAFGPDGEARRDTDLAILAAATEPGFMVATGLPPDLPLDERTRSALAAIFALPEAEKRRLWRHKFCPANSNVYRGFFPAQNGAATYKEGIDLGPDLLDPARARPGDDPLLGPTPLPEESALPGWRGEAAAYYRAMERIAGALMRALARGLGLEESVFDAPFADGISTLRVIHYPLRPPESIAGAEHAIAVEHDGRRRFLVGAPHADSGVLTLLNQDSAGGLQARGPDGSWLDVPPRPFSLAVNFGKLLELWTGGRVRATEHRVLAVSRPRISIPFFYEPAADAVIHPLPLSGPSPMTPLRYGDYLWERMLSFVEFRGIARHSTNASIAASQTVSRPSRPRIG